MELSRHCLLCVSVCNFSPQGGCRGSQSQAGEAQLPLLVPIRQLTLRRLLHPVHGAQQCCPAWSPPPPTCCRSSQGKWTASRLPPVPSSLQFSGAQEPRAPCHSQIQLQEHVWAHTPNPHGPCPDQGLSDCVGLKANHFLQPCETPSPPPPPPPTTIPLPKTKTLP